MSLPPALPKSRRPGCLLAAVAVVVLCLAAAIGLFVHRISQARWSMARVTFEIAQPSSDNGGMLHNPPSWESRQAQVEVIREPVILDGVVRMLELTKAYAEDDQPITFEQARAELRRSVRLRVRDAEALLVTVEVYAHDPHLAANIANTIAVVYRTHRITQLEKALDRSLSQYVDEVKKQRALVRAALDEMQKVRERDQITDPDPEQRASAITGQETGPYLEAKEKYLQQKRIIELAEAALSKAREEETAAAGAPIRILERAVPAIRPLPWWRGDPRE